MGRKMILTIEDKDNGKSDIKFDFYPPIDFEREENNSRILIHCFTKINEALGVTKNDASLGVSE